MNWEASQLLDIMRSFQQELEDIVYHQGVEPFTGEGDTFDPPRQRAALAVPTGDPALAKTISARLHKGPKAGEKVIRPEIVSVHTLLRWATEAAPLPVSVSGSAARRPRAWVRDPVPCVPLGA